MKVSGFFQRFVCVLLVCLLLIPGALADVPDISSLTDDEIVELLGKVNEELVGRGIAKSAELPAGKYTGGKDMSGTNKKQPPVKGGCFVCGA